MADVSFAKPKHTALYYMSTYLRYVFSLGTRKSNGMNETYTNATIAISRVVVKFEVPRFSSAHLAGFSGWNSFPEKF